MSHVIPQIIDPLGQYWKQPSTSEIELRDGKAFMSRRALRRLADYSWSIPTGTYTGKMWRCWHRLASRPSLCWVLCWMGEPHPDGGLRIHRAEIVIR